MKLSRVRTNGKHGRGARGGARGGAGGLARGVFALGVFGGGGAVLPSIPVPPSQARVPKDAASRTPAAGVRWKCHGCGRMWPVWMRSDGKLTHSPDCDDDNVACALCRPDGTGRSRPTIYDPAKPPGSPGGVDGGRPALKPGEFAVEYQLKQHRYAPPTSTPVPGSTRTFANMPIGSVTPGGSLKKVASGIYTRLEDYRVYHDGFDVDPPQGRIVYDRETFERMIGALTAPSYGRYGGYALTAGASRETRPRVFLRVVDHLGTHLKLEDLDRVFPIESAVPRPPPKIHGLFSEDLGGLGEWLKPQEKIDVLRVICRAAGKSGVGASFALDGQSAIVTPPAAFVDAFERRREAFRRAGSPDTTTRLFHGTCAHNIPSILRDGLRHSKLSKMTALGPGIYLGLAPKAVAFAHCCDVNHWIPERNGGPAAIDTYDVFDSPRESLVKMPCSLTRVEKRRMRALNRLHLGVECEVLLGRTYNIDGNAQVPGNDGPRRALGRGDSVYCSRFKQDEWCVYRSDQVLVRKIVVLGENPPPSVPLQ